MRVIAGTARSIPLKAPAGMDTRPTTDKIKETLFNILQFDVQGALFVDLFAGSGAIGIEALSRGAEKALFIDSARAAADVIRENVRKCRFEDRAKILRADASLAVDPPGRCLAGRRGDPCHESVGRSRNQTDRVHGSAVRQRSGNAAAERTVSRRCTGR